MEDARLSTLLPALSRGARLVPISNWDIKNEDDLVHKFVHNLYTTFCYPMSSIWPEKCIYFQNKSRPKRADLVISCQDGQSPLIRMLIEFKFKVQPAEITHEQAKAYKDNMDPPLPLFYSLLYRIGDNFFIEHYDRLDRRLPPNTWPGFFPTIRELYAYYNATWTHSGPPYPAGETLAKIEDDVRKKKWDSAFSALMNDFYYRTAHSDVATACALLHVLARDSRKPSDLPLILQFFYYKILGDTFDNLFDLTRSGICYNRCFAIAQKLRDPQLIALALYLQGISLGRQGTLDEARSKYYEALNYQIPRLDIVIKSELMVASLSEAIPPEKSALRFRQGTIAFLNECRRGLQKKGRVLAKVEQFRKKLIDIPTDFSGCREAIADILHLDSQYRKIDENAKEMHFKHVLVSEEVSEVVKGWALNNWGVTKFDQGDPVGAKFYLDESIKIKKRTGDLATLPYGYHNLALVCRALDNDNEYMQNREGALSFAKTIGDNQFAAYMEAT